VVAVRPNGNDAQPYLSRVDGSPFPLDARFFDGVMFMFNKHRLSLTPLEHVFAFGALRQF
jgi:hypothetical protein